MTKEIKNFITRLNVQTYNWIRTKSGMTQAEFANYFGIPIRNIENWDQGVHVPKRYLVNLMYRALLADGYIGYDE